MKAANVSVVFTIALMVTVCGHRLKRHAKADGMLVHQSHKDTSVSSYMTSKDTDAKRVDHMCDPRTTLLEVGDQWAVRSFMDKRQAGQRLGHFFNKLNVMGHQYIEIVSRDASDGACFATLGLWAYEGVVDLQMADWGVAMNTKRIARCMQKSDNIDLRNEMSSLTDCVEEQYDIQDLPLELTAHTFVARGKIQYEGQLDSTQVELLSLILQQAKKNLDTSPSEHELFGNPVIKMSIKSLCQFGTVEAVTAPRATGRCNCMSFTNQFRADTANLLSDLKYLVDLEAQVAVDKVDPGFPLVEGTECCCTVLNQKTICKLAKAAPAQRYHWLAPSMFSSSPCSEFDVQMIQFRPWNEVTEQNAADDIQNFGRCVLAPDDPSLQQANQGIHKD